MKKVLSVIMATLMLALAMFFAVSCGSKKVPVIGINQLAQHGSLDNCREGFIAGLSEAGYVEGENIEIDFQSAQDVPSVASQIAQNFASTGKDLVCGIATPSAQALYTACYDKGIPVIFNAVSDPVEAKLAVSETETMDGVTGVSDALPVEDQLKLIRAFLPDAKTIGILYTTSEANSVSTLAEYKELAPKYGFEIVDTGVGTKAEIPQAADILVSKVDCISNMTDNAVVASLSVLLEKAAAANIPVFGSEEEQVKNGCIAAAGLDYFALGKETGLIAAEVLGGKDISEIPYKTIKDSIITVNSDVAQTLGITIPEDISASAVDVASN